MAKTKDKPAGPKARNDAYVMMLFITFVAIVTGCVLMYLDNEDYAGKAPPAIPKIETTETKAGDASPPAPGAVVPPPKVP